MICYWRAIKNFKSEPNVENFSGILVVSGYLNPSNQLL